jgi:hypothetical protein
MDLLLDPEPEASEPPRKRHALELQLTRNATISFVTGDAKPIICY